MGRNFDETKITGLQQHQVRYKSRCLKTIGVTAPTQHNVKLASHASLPISLDGTKFEPSLHFQFCTQPNETEKVVSVLLVLCIVVFTILKKLKLLIQQVAKSAKNPKIRCYAGFFATLTWILKKINYF
jgi:hypothetical protein